MTFEERLNQWMKSVQFPSYWVTEQYATDQITSHFGQWLDSDRDLYSYQKLADCPAAYCAAVRKVITSAVVWHQRQREVGNDGAAGADEQATTAVNETLKQIAQFVRGSKAFYRDTAAAAARQLLERCYYGSLEEAAAARELLITLLLNFKVGVENVADAHLQVALSHLFGNSVTITSTDADLDSIKWATGVVTRLLEFCQIVGSYRLGRYRMMFPVVEKPLIHLVDEDSSEGTERKEVFRDTNKEVSPGNIHLTLFKTLETYGGLVNVVITAVPRAELEQYNIDQSTKQNGTNRDGKPLSMILAPWSTYLLGDGFPELQGIADELTEKLTGSPVVLDADENEQSSQAKMVFIVEAHPIDPNDLLLAKPEVFGSFTQRQAAAAMFSPRSDFLIEGKSLGAAIGLATFAAYQQLSLRPCILTGAIDNRASIDPIDGVQEKLSVAADFVNLFPSTHRPLVVFPIGNEYDVLDDEYGSQVLLIDSLTGSKSESLIRNILSDGFDLWRNALASVQKQDSETRSAEYDLFKHSEEFRLAVHRGDLENGLCASDWSAANNALESKSQGLHLIPVAYNEDPKIVASWLLVKLAELEWSNANEDWYSKPVALPVCLKTLADGLESPDKPPVGLSELSRREQRQRLCDAINAGIDGLDTPLVAPERNLFMKELADMLPTALRIPGKLNLIGYDSPSNSLVCDDAANARRAAMLQFLNHPIGGNKAAIPLNVFAVVSDEHYLRWARFELEANTAISDKL